MNKAAIITLIRNNHQSFVLRLQQLSDDDFVLERKGKWTAGQQLAHIILSVKPLTKGLQLPAFLLKWIFGKANRPSRSYDELVARYQQKLIEGGKASAAYIPPRVKAEDRVQMLKELGKQTDRLCRLVDGFSEEQLDKLVAPHPLLGKLTLREMLYFTANHIRHHSEQVKNNLIS